MYFVITVQLLTKKWHESTCCFSTRGEKSHLIKCEFCDYSCSQKGRIDVHVASVHEGKKSFICEYCDYSHAQKVNMMSHITGWKESIGHVKKSL